MAGETSGAQSDRTDARPPAGATRDRHGLTVVPIADDDNALEQFYAAITRIEDGIGGITELALKLTAAPPTPPPTPADPRVAEAIASLNLEVIRARSGGRYWVYVHRDELAVLLVALGARASEL